MKKLIISLVLISITLAIHAQSKKSVVIGTQIDKPNAILVINPPNSNQGFMVPQLTSAQRQSIGPASPLDDGLMVYDITEQAFYYWSAGQWIKGLDDESKGLSYDASTHTLSLGGTSSVDLSDLEELPPQTGNAGRYLTTNGTTLSWANINSIGDITGIVTGAGMTGGTSSGDATLSVNTDGTTISVNGSNQLQLSDAAVSEAKIRPGGANQVMTTNAAGTNAQWVTPSGDIGGPIESMTVTRIQGRDVANTAPNLGEALTWNGLAWGPAPVTVTAAIDYYAVDPADFQGLEPNGNSDPVTGLGQSDNTFVTALNSARQIIAPVNLPHGATIQNMTAYYNDNDLLGDVTIRFIRKRLDGGANEVLSTATPILISLVVQSQSMPAVPVASRVVDNNTYSYRIHVIFNHLLDYANVGGSAQRIYGFKIEYTK
jgi:hypothetical protein